MKYALITGASRGVGASSAKKLASMGYHTICVARDEEKLKAVVAEIRDNSGEADYIPTDLMQDKDILKLVSTVLDKYGPPSICVFSAGFSSDKSFNHSTSDLRRQEMQVNFFSTSLILEKLIPHCEDLESSHFIAIGSLSGITGFPMNASYAASKSALYAFWISLSEEYSDSNLDFSILIPGLLNTEMSKNYGGMLKKRSPDCVSEQIPALIRNPQIGKTLGIENKLALMMSRLAPNLSTKAFSYLSRTLLERKKAS